MELALLPSEVLKHISRYLDDFSFVSLAISNRRLRGILLNQKERRKIFDISKQYVNPITRKVTDLRQLDLSNSLIESGRLAALIRECPHLTELNIVNSNLTFADLANVIETLPNLEILSFSLLNCQSDFNWENSLLNNHPKLRKLYVDCNPSVRVLVFIADVLNKCKCVEFVHLNFIGMDSRFQDLDMRRASGVSRHVRQHWAALHTIIGSFHLANKEFRFKIMQDFIAFCASLQIAMYVRCDMFFYRVDRLWSEDVDATELVATKSISTLEEKYHFDSHYVELPMHHCIFRWPINIVELDLTFLTLCFPESSWKDLIETSPHIEALAVPLCFLPVNLQIDRRRLDPALARALDADSYVVSALENLKLKKLHISSNEHQNCPRCRDASTRYVLGDLDRLLYLEEFTMDKIRPNPDLFLNLANIQAKCVKLTLKEAPSLQDLDTMLETSPKLKYFKLEAPNLPLHSELLWKALAKCNTLRQVCLASGLGGAIDFDVVGNYLPNVLKNLEVVHLHAQHQQDLYEKVKEYVEFLNATRPFQKIQLLSSSCLSLSHIENMTDIFPIPGRNLCSSSSLISKITLQGWELD